MTFKANKPNGSLEVLRRHFGYGGFRPGQDVLVNAILAGRDVLGVMPTGAGKSICFQVPALLLEGLTLVVSPLISLMKDQVDGLVAAGLPAVFLNSTMGLREIREAFERIRSGACRLVYVAPERLENAEFLAFVASVQVSQVAVDEAHCVSQWGHDFRPSYSGIGEFVDGLSVRPVLSAFTATATADVRKDIEGMLGLVRPLVLVTGFDRPNLRYEARRPDDKYDSLMMFLEGRRDVSGLIYCATRKTVDGLSERLLGENFSVLPYHAGLSDGDRRRNQEAFLSGEVSMVVATNAFGMGIDKPDVRYVVHFDLPKDMEGYYQEAGRAGRDGLPADCLLLYAGRDVMVNRWLIDNDSGYEGLDDELREKLKERAHGRLKKMVSYCFMDRCLRGYILGYFGEKISGVSCGSCGNCDAARMAVDSLKDSKNLTSLMLGIIACVYEVGERFGVGVIIDVLLGRNAPTVSRHDLNDVASYGTMDMDEGKLRKTIFHLVSAGYLERTEGEYPVLVLSSRGRGVLPEGLVAKGRSGGGNGRGGKPKMKFRRRSR